MLYAVVKASGSQYKVKEDQEIDLFRVGEKKGDKIVFDQVLMVRAEDKVLIGKPLVVGAAVEGTVVDHFKDKKIRVAKYKAKSRYRKVMGHRDELTRVKIEKINYGKD